MQTTPVNFIGTVGILIFYSHLQRAVFSPCFLGTSMSMSPCRNLFSLLVLLGFGVLFSGCTETKTAQCQKIILLTQTTAQASAKYRQTTDKQEVLEIAARFEEAGEKLRDFKFNDAQLAQFQNQLAAIYQGNAETTRTLISALESKDILTVKLAQDKVKKIGQQEQQIITDLNRYCRTENSN